MSTSVISRRGKSGDDEASEHASAGAQVEHLDRGSAVKGKEIDHGPVEVVEARHQLSSRAIVRAGGEVESTLD
jgi:hypothetical protein